eukprot:UN07359
MMVFKFAAFFRQENECWNSGRTLHYCAIDECNTRSISKSNSSKHDKSCAFENSFESVCNHDVGKENSV